MCLKNPDDSTYSDLENSSVLKGFADLTELELQDCRSLKELNGLSELHKLKALDLNGCKTLQDLDGLQNITRISIKDCASIENLDALEGMKKIKLYKYHDYIDLSGCDSLKDVKGLTGLKDFTSLRLRNIQFENLELISGLTHLEEITLHTWDNGSKLKDLSGLNKMSKLFKLDLDEAYPFQAPAPLQAPGAGMALAACAAIKGF